MANEVKTDFIVGADSGIRAIDQYKAKLLDLEKPTNFAPTSNAATDKVAAGFNKATEAVKDFEKSAKEAERAAPTISRYWENEENKVRQSVEKIKRDTASVSGTGYAPSGRATFIPPGVFGDKAKPVFDVGYGESEFNTAVKRIRTVGSEAEKLAEKTEGVTKRLAPLRGYGAIFRELNLGINETEINAVTAGAAAAGIGVATLATFGAVAVAGAAIVKVTEQIKSEAESRLLSEERIAGAINKQVFGLRDALKEYEKYKQAVIGDKAFSDKLSYDVGTFDRPALQAERGGIDADNKARIENINKLQSKLAYDEQAVEFEKSRKSGLIQNFLSGVGIGNEFTASQKNQNVGSATRTLEETKKALAEQEQLFDKGKSKLEQTDKALTDLTSNQNKNFNDNGENQRKSAEQARKYEDERVAKQNEIAKKRADNIDSAVKKVDELGKKYADTFDNLYIATSKNNPLAQVFSEGDKAIDKLRENLKGLKPELLAIAESLQKTANDNKEFGTRLDNDLSALDLKQKADDLRKFGKDISRPNELTLDKTDPKKFFTDFIDYYSKQIELGANRLAPIYAAESNFGGNVRVDRNPFTNFHANIFADKNGKQYTAGFSQSNALEELTNDFDRVSKADGSFGGFSRRTRSFADLTEKEKLQFLDKDNIGFQNKLSASFDLAENRKALNPEQQGEIDRKIISLASGVDPSKLTDHQREIVASSLEKEAQRKDDAERNAQRERIFQSGYQKNISEYIDTLKAQAKTGGTSALDKLLVEIKDAPTTKSTVQRANPSDTAKQMDLSGTYFEQSRK